MIQNWVRRPPCVDCIGNATIMLRIAITIVWNCDGLTSLSRGGVLGQVVFGQSVIGPRIMRGPLNLSFLCCRQWRRVEMFYLCRDSCAYLSSFSLGEKKG